MKVPEFFTAKYDSFDDKIIGCTKGTMIWDHEDRHRMQFECLFNRPWFRTFNDLNVIAISSMVLLVAFRNDLWPMVWLACTPLCGFQIGAELDAWFYAIIQRIRKVKLWMK